jgi:hypothetical protein
MIDKNKFTALTNEDYQSEIYHGLRLRDYYAAKAMQAIISNSDQQSISVEEVNEWVGEYAYTVADAMMKARNK